MLSSTELLFIVSGRSSLLDPEQISKQLSSAKDKLLQGLGYYKSPSNDSEAKLKADKTIKRPDLVLKLSKLLDLDEIQTHHLFQSYLRTDFRGSSAQLMNILRHDSETENFLLEVVEYYHKERSALLKCIKHIFGYWQNEECLFRDQFAMVVDELIGLGFLDKVLSQYKGLCSKAATAGNKVAQGLFAIQYVKEQADLLEIMLLYHKEFDMAPDRMFLLAKLFQSQLFGMKQINKRFLDASSNQLVERIGYLQSLILLEAVDLEMLKKIQKGDRSSQDHHLLSMVEKTQELDELLASWGELHPHGPPLLGWVVFRFVALEGEQEEVTRHLGQVALQSNVFQYLLDLVKNGIQLSPLPVENLARKLLYSLMDLILCLFHESTLGDVQVLLSLVCESLSEPVSATEFWASDSQSGMHLFLKSAKNKFPYQVCPLLDLLECSCKDEESAKQVFHYLSNLNTFSELFGKNQVDEISATSDGTVWKRNVDRLLIGHDGNNLIIPTGSLGRPFQIADEVRLIRWNYSYSGWFYLALELQHFLLRPYDGESDESEVERMTSIIRLLTSIIEFDWSKVATLDLLVSGAISIIDRFAPMQSPPLNLLAVCMKCLQVVVQRKTEKVWKHLQQIGFLPRMENSITHDVAGSCQNVIMGHLGTILMSFECPSGAYPVTKEYLKFFLEFIQAIHENKQNLHDFFKAIYPDYIANVVLIVRDMLGGFSQWRFTVPGEKETLAERLLQIANVILAQTQDDIGKQIPRDFRADSIVRKGFLYHEAGEMTLNIISIGVDAVIRSTAARTRGTSEVSQVVKLAFSLLFKLLIHPEQREQLAPLEDSLCVQYVTQQGPISHLQVTDKVTLISVLAKYIYYQLDAKLPTLAVMVLQRLCLISPISMAAALEPDAAAIRKAFITRLQQGIEPTRLKVAILEFITTAAKHQPGLMELFVHLIPSKKAGSTNLTFGKFSCLGPTLDILCPKTEGKGEPLILLVAAVRLLEAFWVNRRDSVLNALRGRDNFWQNLLHHLRMAFQDKIAQEEEECISHTLKIIALEMYYVRENYFDQNLKDSMKKHLTSEFYTGLCDRLQHCKETNKELKGLLTFLDGFKTFLFVGSLLHAERCNMSRATQELILVESTRGLRNWMLASHGKLGLAIVHELADIVMVLAKRWSRSVENPDAYIEIIVEILQEVYGSDGRISVRLQSSLLCATLHFLHAGDEKKEKGKEKGRQVRRETLLSLLPVIFRSINFHVFTWDKETKQHEETIQLAVVAVSVTTQVAKMLPSANVMTEIMREHSLLPALLQAIELCLKNLKEIAFVKAGMLLLQALSKLPELAESMVANGIAQLMSLQLNMTYALPQDTPEHKGYGELYEVWCMGISIVCNLLKSLNHAYLPSALDFVGAHRERLARAAKVMKRVHSQILLRETEEVSKFLFQLTKYPRDWHFALPGVMSGFQREIVELTETTVALLARPRLLNHLVEVEKEEHVESMLERARTPSPLTIDSSRSYLKDDASDNVSPSTEAVQEKLLSVLANCVGCLLHLSPDVREAIMDESFDFDGFIPLVELGFNSPSLNSENHPSFGILLSCMNICLRMLYKMTTDDASKSPSMMPESIESSDKRRSLLTYIMEATMVVVMSQATCYLRHPEVDTRSKQFLKRELGSELSNLLHALHRHMTRRGIPPSPVSGDKLSGSSSSVYKRSPSKLGPLFADSDERTIYKLTDIYTKQLLR